MAASDWNHSSPGCSGLRWAAADLTVE